MIFKIDNLQLRKFATLRESFFAKHIYLYIHIQVKFICYIHTSVMYIDNQIGYICMNIDNWILCDYVCFIAEKTWKCFVMLALHYLVGYWGTLAARTRCGRWLNTPSSQLTHSASLHASYHPPSRISSACVAPSTTSVEATKGARLRCSGHSLCVWHGPCSLVKWVRAIEEQKPKIPQPHNRHTTP